MKEQHAWGWPIACYLFLGGLGGGMTILAAVADLFFGVGDVFSLALIVAAACIGFGCFFLIFELTRPLQFWRVFSKQKAILTFGAWMLGIEIVVDAIYFSFYLDFIPWAGTGAAHTIVAAVALLLACGVVLYTGVMLSSLKARAFWNTPALPVLFTISGLSTGAAANSLLAGIWPYAGTVETVESVHAILHTLDIVLVVFELIVVLLYVVMMYTSSNPTARRAAGRWIFGSYSTTFWAGLVAVGLVLPLAFYILGGVAAAVLAPVFAIIGGIFLRFLVVFSDDRRLFSGEERYWERLPRGDEAFLEAWK